LASTGLLVLLSCMISLAIVEAYAVEGDDEYRLKIRAEPNIIFIGGGGLYPTGAEIITEEAPKNFQGYKFQGWKIDGTWAQGNPITVRMDRNHEVVAVYEKSDTNLIKIDSIPRIADITIDGEIYLSNELPAKFNWDLDSDHFLSIPLIVSHDKDPLTRYVFDSWKDQSTEELRTITVDDEGESYVALYKTEVYLKPISEQGIVLGGGWQEKNSAVSFELESEIVEDKKDENIRYVFNSWNLGDYPNSPANSLDLLKPTTVQARWDTQYKLQLITNIPGYEIFGTGWYDLGRQVALIAEESLESPKSDINYVFDRWVSKGPNPIIVPNAHSSSTTIAVIEPFLIEAHYKKSYQVNVWTPYGSAIGSGFYDEGTTAEISMAKTEIAVDPNKERKIFSGWNTHGARTVDFSETQSENANNLKEIGNQNLLVFVDNPINVTANWKTQYHLNVVSEEVEAKGEGWYDLGRLATVSLKTSNSPPGMWSTQVFDRWTGDVDSEDSKVRVMMNEPKTVIAEFREDNTPGMINAFILAGIGIVGAIVYRKTHKPPTFGTTANKNNNENKPKAFDSFFNVRKGTSDSQQKSESFSKPRKLESILSWLMGRKD